LLQSEEEVPGATSGEFGQECARAEAKLRISGTGIARMARGSYGGASAEIHWANIFMIMNKIGVIITAGVLVLVVTLVFTFRARASDAAPPAMGETKHGPQRVKPEQAQKLIADKKVVVLDVRTPSEFAAGHIAGATNLDYKAEDFKTKVAALDKNQAYLVHCASGVRSASACAVMDKLDFKTIYDLKGGISAWQDAGLPVEK
jgi:rhodanese-related sulfurtransferase